MAPSNTGDPGSPESETNPERTNQEIIDEAVERAVQAALGNITQVATQVATQAAMQASAASSAATTAGTIGTARTSRTSSSVFSLTPGLMSVAPYDWNSQADVKIFKQGTTELTSTFDMTPGKLKLFLTDLAVRSGVVGWKGILTIPTSKGGKVVSKDLLTEYGQVSLDDVKKHVLTYIMSNTRDAQCETQLYLCIYSSLSETARECIALRASEYTFGDRMSGSVYLKIIIGETHMDTNATTKYLRDNLNTLDEYIVSVESNIVKFNQYVDMQLDGLHARGETTHDLLNNLFKAYKGASDKKFVDYIGRKEEEYEDGTAIEPKDLMHFAKQRYLARVKGETWNAPTEDEAKIIALEAEVKKLTKTPGENNKNRNGNQERSSNTKGAKKDDRPAWMFVKPSEGDPHTKVTNGKEYHWCPTHNAWGRHTSGDCRGRGFNPNGNNERTNTRQENPPPESAAEGTQNNATSDNRTRALRMSTVLANMAEVEDAESTN